MIRVMLVDDHAVVRVGFRMLLQASDATIEVVAEADSGEQALQRVAAVQPDVLVLDLSMPGLGGLETVRRLRAHTPELKVLVLSGHEDTAHVRRTLTAGAQGYLSKRSAPETLVQAVRSVAAGQRYIDPALAQKLALAQLGDEPNPVEALSEREFLVFEQLARGATVAAIAEQLKLSPSTVGTHLYHVKQKLGAANQAELTLIALRWGVIDAS